MSALPPVDPATEVQMVDVVQALAQEYAQLKIEYCVLRLAHAKLLASMTANGFTPTLEEP